MTDQGSAPSTQAGQNHKPKESAVTPSAMERQDGSAGDADPHEDGAGDDDTSADRSMADDVSRDDPNKTEKLARAGRDMDVDEQSE